MKLNRLLSLVSLCSILGTLQAQTSYEASSLLDTDLSGTARYVGMGGAMSALGTDMSTMSTNPAGTALNRRWDIAFSLGGNWATQHSQTNVGSMRAFSSYASLGNAGVVVTTEVSDERPLRFVNFGFNYRNVKRFGDKMSMEAHLGGLSQTGQMARQVWDNRALPDIGIEGITPSHFDAGNSESFYEKNYYASPWVGWLTLLGTDARLVNAAALNEGGYPYAESGNYRESLHGGVNACDFNLSVNLLDAVYLGVTFTTYDVDRALESVYSERLVDASYTLTNYYRTMGTGYDFKFGAIVRPFSESSFRVGLSASTPTVYTLRDWNSAIIESEFTLRDASETAVETVLHGINTWDEAAYGRDYVTDYTMMSPAKFNVSLGGTIARSWALGAEYEYTDYSKIRLYEVDGMENIAMNEHTRDIFTGHHTLRLGVEKVFGRFYTRAGYNYLTGGYKRDAWKMIPVNSVQTNTAYTNLRSTSNYTCGIGYRGDVYYIDAAMLYGVQLADFYPFDDSELKATTLSRNLIKGAVTIGMRF